MSDCSAKIADYMESRITHEQLIEWVREAMLAQEMPLFEQRQIMDLLQDLSQSTPRSLANAAKNYRRMASPLVQGIPRWPN